MHKTSNIANILNFIDSDKIVSVKPIGAVDKCTIDLVNGNKFTVRYNGGGYVLEEHTKEPKGKKVSNLTDFNVLVTKLESFSNAEIQQVTLG